MHRRVGLVGADSDAASELCLCLEDEPISVFRVRDVASFAAALRREDYDAMVLADTLSLSEVQLALAEIGATCPGVPVIALAKELGPELVTKLVHAGVTDTLRVPFTRQEAALVLRKALLLGDHEENQSSASGSINLDTASAEMRSALAMADRAARSTTTVLIRGESGVGKEVFARRIHEQGRRASQPFVKVHCAALPEQILESELFGYEKGAFTGAVSRKIGRFELASGGTLFLDEIGDVSLAVQVKLLRVLQDREFERLGGTRTIKADVRVVAATHRNLERMLKSGEFREDLYYRLNVLPIEVPPLRKRPDHVATLAQQFCLRFAALSGRRVVLSQGAIELLVRAPWPGNVRQLQNVVERLVVLSETSEIGASEVATELGRDAHTGDEASAELSTIELSRVVQKAERRALCRALERAQGNRSMAARLLGVSRRTLFYKIREHKLG